MKRLLIFALAVGFLISLPLSHQLKAAGGTCCPPIAAPDNQQAGWIQFLCPGDPADSNGDGAICKLVRPDLTLLGPVIDNTAPQVSNAQLQFCTPIPFCP